MGLRYSNEASWTQVLNNIEYMSDCTNIPILLDGDTGYGNFNNARRLIKKLEQREIAGVCFEDKLFPKTNSFLNGEKQQLADINEFCGKIEACKDTQYDPDFQVVARLESFITGRGLDDALERANAYCEAGADAILVHSKKADSSDIEDFVKHWTLDTPLVIVPTKYYKTPTETFRDLNISTVIWANHNIRASIEAMQKTSKQIYNDESLMGIEDSVVPVKEIFRLQDNDELEKAEKKYFSNYNFKKKKYEWDSGEPLIIKRQFSTSSRNPITETERNFINSKELYDLLSSHNIDFYTGVPDSLLKDFLAFLKDTSDNNIITANEGLSVSFATGYHLATGKIPCVYLQNSGLGNTINPLMSLVHEKVYNIPMLLLVGWRGEPYKKDEPQHVAQGEISETILNGLGIKYSILPDHIKYAQFIIDESVEYIKETNKPCVLLVKRQTFKNYTPLKESNSNANIKRYSALKIIAEQLSDYKIVSTTGFISRELYDIRKKQNNNFGNDFYVVGSMGHCSSIATGLAMYSDKKIVCIDGDGSALMHLGSMSTIGNLKPNNLIHILLNNNAHESVGGQTTNCSNTNFVEIAKGCGYTDSYLVNSEKKLIQSLEDIQKFERTGPIFIEVKINTGTIESLGRPDNNFIDVKKKFMD